MYIYIYIYIYIGDDSCKGLGKNDAISISVISVQLSSY